jgi:chorismate synthase
VRGQVLPGLRESLCGGELIKEAVEFVYLQVMNTFGRKFRVEIFGESHGAAIGCVLDGVPAGIELSSEDFAGDIARRSPGAKGAEARGEKELPNATTPRCEADTPEILSGVFEGRTTGSPLAIIFRNSNTRSSDYSQFRDIPRPGHADYVAGVKWNACNDPRGGGHFSGRITLPLVAAGVVAKKALSCGLAANFGLAPASDSAPSISAELIQIGGVSDKSIWPSLLEDIRKQGDSLGGVVECTIKGLPVGLGEPFFDSVESIISHGIFSIPGVRGIEFGDGFRAAAMRGSEHNDPYGQDGKPSKNGAGGINGGITNGSPIVFRVAFKPTSSIARAQQSWNFTESRMDTLEVKGRHDVCFALRTPVIVEAVAAAALLDLLLLR